MMAASDLFDYADVVEHADAIAGSLRSGQMPCDGVTLTRKPARP